MLREQNAPRVLEGAGTGTAGKDPALLPLTDLGPGGKLPDVLSASRPIFRRTFRGPAALSMGVALLAVAWPSRAQEHGFVEPCQVYFIEDHTLSCEQCIPSPTDPKHCADLWGDKGYEKKCQTGFHSKPAEVWCISRAAKEAGKPWVLVSVVGGVAMLAGLFLFAKRRRATT